jgi:hypothetical protein
MFICDPCMKRPDGTAVPAIASVVLPHGDGSAAVCGEHLARTVEAIQAEYPLTGMTVQMTVLPMS